VYEEAFHIFHTQWWTYHLGVNHVFPTQWGWFMAGDRGTVLPASGRLPTSVTWFFRWGGSLSPQGDSFGMMVEHLTYVISQPGFKMKTFAKTGPPHPFSSFLPAATWVWNPIYLYFLDICNGALQIT
jgi:hypothetical protein